MRVAAAPIVRSGAAVQAGAIVALFLAALGLYGRGAPGYDGSYAVLWGTQAASGELPDYVAPFAPTPHPLANLVALALSPLGSSGLAAYVLLVLLGFAALTWFAYLLGARLFAPAVGA